MFSCVNSFGIDGIDGYLVSVEADVSNGLPTFELVGLPDAAVKESRERVRSAIRNSGFVYPSSRITINLAPADMRKEGSYYDLPMATGLLLATGQIPSGKLDDAVMIGELSLTGEVRPVKGVLPMVIAARTQGFRRFLLPPDNAAEGACVEGIDILPIADLRTLTQYLTDQLQITPYPVTQWDQPQQQLQAPVDMALVKGQTLAKRAMEIAAAGGHNMIMVGPPGSGKTMLARCMPTILPDLTFEEALEITKIHSIADALPTGSGIVRQRPFRAPHHTASAASLIGGGTRVRPGEISLAHFGVLFLDELPEFNRVVLEAMRQPLEDGFVHITRAAGAARFPSRFMLLAAMNPCPCGHFGSSSQTCRCSPTQIQRYLNRVSGPLLDRMDLEVEVDAVHYDHLTDDTLAESSTSIKARVNAARKIQLDRYQGQNILFNAQLSNEGMNRYCVLDDAGNALMESIFSRLKLSARAYTRILKVARTIADLAGSADIKLEHLAEAVQYRSLDRKYWGGNA